MSSTHTAPATLLSHEELCDLIRIYRDETRPEAERIEARNRVVMSSLDVVDKVVARFGWKGHLEDARQAGVFGLMRAVKAYDDSKGIDFQTSAWPYVRGAVIQSTVEARVIRTPVNIRRIVSAVRRAGLDFDATVEAIAAAAPFATASDIRWLKARGGRVADAYGWDDADRVFASASHAENTDAPPSPVVRKFREAVASLGPRDYQIFSVFHGLDGPRMGAAGAAAKFGVSEAQVEVVVGRVRQKIMARMGWKTTKAWTPHPCYRVEAKACYSPSDLAAMLRVSDDVVKGWIDGGHIRAVPKPYARGVTWSVSHADLMGFLLARPEFSGLVGILGRDVLDQNINVA